MKIRKVGGYTNYDKSEFDSQSVLLNGDKAKMKDVYDSLYNLSEFIDLKNFKSYDELKKRLQDVLGGDIRGVASDTAKTAEDYSESDFSEKKSNLKEKASKNEPEEEIDALEYFEQFKNA